MDSATVSDHFQPWRHEGGHAPFSLAWMTAVGERTNAPDPGHLGADPDLPLQPGRHRPGVRDHGLPVPRPDLPRRRHRRGAQRDRHRLPGRVAGVQGAVRAAARVGEADARAVARRPRRLRRASTTGPRAPRSTTCPRAASRCTSRRAGPWSPGTQAVRATASSAPRARVWSSTRRSSSPPSQRAREAAGRDVDEIDKMIEIKISYDTDPELALENTRFWAPLSLTAEQKHRIDDPIEMEKAADALPIEQVAKRWIVASDPDEAVEKVKQYVEVGPEPPGVPRPRPRSAPVPRAVPEATWSRGCAASADTKHENSSSTTWLGCWRPSSACSR